MIANRASLFIRREPELRARCFLEGFRAAGFDARIGPPSQSPECRALLTWNRYGENEHAAERVERAGGVVLVAENGYLGCGGTSPKFDLASGMHEAHYIALSRGQSHNTVRAAVTAQDGAARFAALGIELKPWRERGEHVLVCPNRSFGAVGRIMPSRWAHDVAARLKRLTSRPVRVRVHPGGNRPAIPLAEELRDAWAVVIWHSTVGVHALAEGVPVLCDGPEWILRDLAGSVEQVEEPPMPPRQTAFERLACAQWTLGEIRTGEPIRRLLDA